MNTMELRNNFHRLIDKIDSEIEDKENLNPDAKIREKHKK